MGVSEREESSMTIRALYSNGEGLEIGNVNIWAGCNKLFCLGCIQVEMFIDTTVKISKGN